MTRKGNITPSHIVETEYQAPPIKRIACLNCKKTEMIPDIEPKVFVEYFIRQHSGCTPSKPVELVHRKSWMMKGR